MSCIVREIHSTAHRRRHSERRAEPEVEILRKQNRYRRNLGGVPLRMTRGDILNLQLSNKSIDSFLQDADSYIWD